MIGALPVLVMVKSMVTVSPSSTVAARLVGVALRVAGSARTSAVGTSASKLARLAMISRIDSNRRFIGCDNGCDMHDWQQLQGHYSILAILPAFQFCHYTAADACTATVIDCGARQRSYRLRSAWCGMFGRTSIFSLRCRL